MEFRDIVMKRYAVKKFDGRQIPEDKVHALLEMIRFAPSSWNLQPWRIKIIADKETKKKLKPASYNQEQITTCSHLLVFCAYSNILPLIDRLEKIMADVGIPDAASRADIMRDFANNMNEEQTLSWSQRQTFLALGNALNGAKSLGFDSCPMEGFEPEKYSAILNIQEGLMPTAVCAIGYAADSPNKKLRFRKEDVFF